MYRKTISYFCNNPAQACIALGTAAAAIVGSAWVFQLIGYAPCQLCLWQRIPYYIVIPLLVSVGVATMTFGLNTKIAKWTLGLCLFVLAAGGVLALYHSGVEWGFWSGPTSCGAGGNFASEKATDLFAALDSTRPPSCNEAAGRFLGLSFAGWNAVAAFSLTAIGLAVFRNIQPAKLVP